MRYVALLRGVNVGGNNIIKMSDLKRVFEQLGCNDVITYIQSGNVVFESRAKSPARLTGLIETALATEFHASFGVVVLTAQQLENVTKNAPVGFGGDPGRYRYDVAFVRPPARAELILSTISLKDSVDEAFEGNGVLYFKRLISRASESHLSRLPRHIAYTNMTIRNWNTTTRLCRMTAGQPTTAS
jgi:uncharacterized protein (DUF1697 family)